MSEETRNIELYEAIEKRRTVREFLDREVDFEAVKRILEAGNKRRPGIITANGISSSCGQMRKKNMPLNMQRSWRINSMPKSI